MARSVPHHTVFKRLPPVYCPVRGLAMKINFCGVGSLRHTIGGYALLCPALVLSASAFAGSLSISQVYVDKRTYGEGPYERRSDPGIELRYEQPFGAQAAYLMHVEFQEDGNFRYASVDAQRRWRVASFEVHGGLQLYQQKSPGLDGGDTGTKVITGITHQSASWIVSMDYLSEDLEGSDPDDAGDYVELSRYRVGLYRAATENIHVGMSVSSTSNGDLEYSLGLRFGW